jgi:hypothetical protein
MRPCSLSFVGVIALVFALLLSATPPAQAAGFASQDALNSWMQAYAQRHDTARMADAVRFGATNLDQQSRLIGFLAGVLRTQPDLADGLGNAKEGALLARALWYSGLPDASARVEALVKNNPVAQAALPPGNPVDLLAMPLDAEHDWGIEALWGNYLATGQDAPLARLTITLPWYQENPAVFDRRLLLGGQARWLLISQAKADPKALAALQRIQKRTADPRIASALAEVIAEAKKR